MVNTQTQGLIYQAVCVERSKQVSANTHFLMHLHKKQRIIMDFAKCIFIFLPNEKMKQETFTRPQRYSHNLQRISFSIVFTHKWPAWALSHYRENVFGPLGPLIIFLIQASKGKEGENYRKIAVRSSPHPIVFLGHVIEHCQ